MESKRIVTEAEITTHDLTITGINHNICKRQYTCRNFCIYRIIKVIISQSLRISCNFICYDNRINYSEYKLL